MIISCPSCTTRYDVVEDRFLPDGRSVRCAECGESWFVPAPEPIEDLVPLTPRRAAPRRAPEAASEQPSSAYDDAEEDSLFERHEPASRPAPKGAPRFRIAPEEEEAADRGRRDYADGERESAKTRSQNRAREAAADDLLPARDEKGRFIKTKSGRRDEPTFDGGDDDDALFARARDDRSARDRRVRDDAHEEQKREWRDPRDRWREERASDATKAKGRDEARAYGEAGRRAPVVDAHFEDVDDRRGHDRAQDYGDERDRGFGRKVRDDRRRATALVTVEDLEPVAERVFNDEFFHALRVQPRELERAIRKARRRAEARDKNRLTPLNILGWSAWAGALAATLFVAYTYRDNIVAAFPNAAGAYEAVGIEANAYGLKIENVKHRVALSTSGPVIEITGRLHNTSGDAVAPPMLQAEALGPRGELLSRWTFAANADRIGQRESVPFSTRSAAPEGVAEVALSFAPTEGVRVKVGDLLKQDN